MLIKQSQLRAIVAEILRRGGSENAEAELVSRHLVDADLSGHDSHGVGMIPKYVEDLKADLVKPNVRPSLVKDDGAVMIFDGGRGYGRPAAEEAMAAGLERCRETGVEDAHQTNSASCDCRRNSAPRKSATPAADFCG